MTASHPIPKLQPGDRLTRDEFERRYDAMPELKKAELIEGVVYMASAVRYTQHGMPEHLLGAWMTFYEVLTPGLGVVGNTSLRLDLDNEPQPDLLMRVPEHAGGTSRVGPEGYLEGPPELIAEIAASSVSYDLHQKLQVYRRHGVKEYLVHRVDDGEVDWFLLERGEYVRQELSAEGLWKSRTFPGLWLSPALLLAGDLRALRDLVERGCREPEHAAFAARIAAR